MSATKDWEPQGCYARGQAQSQSAVFVFSRYELSYPKAWRCEQQGIRFTSEPGGSGDLPFSIHTLLCQTFQQSEHELLIEPLADFARGSLSRCKSARIVCNHRRFFLHLASRAASIHPRVSILVTRACLRQPWKQGPLERPGHPAPRTDKSPTIVLNERACHDHRATIEIEFAYVTTTTKSNQQTYTFAWNFLSCKKSLHYTEEDIFISRTLSQFLFLVPFYFFSLRVNHLRFFLVSEMFSWRLNASWRKFLGSVTFYATKYCAQFSNNERNDDVCKGQKYWEALKVWRTGKTLSQQLLAASCSPGVGNEALYWLSVGPELCWVLGESILTAEVPRVHHLPESAQRSFHSGYSGVRNVHLDTK